MQRFRRYRGDKRTCRDLSQLGAHDPKQTFLIDENGPEISPGYVKLTYPRRRSSKAIVMAANGFEVRCLSGSIGAEILSIDLASEPGDNVIDEIRKVWLEHNVIFFRDQDLPPAKFLAFAKRFGEVVEYPFVKGIEGFPEIIPVIKLEHETKNFGGIWHTDTAYLEIPPMGTMLIAREVPPYGGDTLFANTYLAYETLSEGMKRMLDGLIAVNHSAKADVTCTREDRVREGGKAEATKEYISEASRSAHASGNRTQGALHQYWPHGAFQGYDRS